MLLRSAPACRKLPQIYQCSFSSMKAVILGSCGPGKRMISGAEVMVGGFCHPEIRSPSPAGAPKTSHFQISLTLSSQVALYRAGSSSNSSNGPSNTQVCLWELWKSARGRKALTFRRLLCAHLSTTRSPPNQPRLPTETWLCWDSTSLDWNL